MALEIFYEMYEVEINKEMKTVCKASFKGCKYKHGYEPPLEEVANNPTKYLIGYKEIICHITFDINLNGKFTRKAQFVTDGSKTY